MIRLKFYLNKADLYSFWISAWRTGESCGYTSGGGPGLSDKGDRCPRELNREITKYIELKKLYDGKKIIGLINAPFYSVL